MVVNVGYDQLSDEIQKTLTQYSQDITEGLNKAFKELAESVFIDWNYDGVTFSPETTDIPEKNELVKGEYDIPESAGTIHIKITDLISESWEGTIEAEAE